MDTELIDKSCGCQEVLLPEQSVRHGNVAEITMRTDLRRKAESKA